LKTSDAPFRSRQKESLNRVCDEQLRSAGRLLITDVSRRRPDHPRNGVLSIYSDISSRIIARSSSKRNSASARAVAVFPTPVGPRNNNEPTGLFGSCNRLWRGELHSKPRPGPHSDQLHAAASALPSSQASAFRPRAFSRPARCPFRYYFGNIFFINLFLQHDSIALKFRQVSVAWLPACAPVQEYFLLKALTRGLDRPHFGPDPVAFSTVELRLVLTHPSISSFSDCHLPSCRKLFRANPQYAVRCRVNGISTSRPLRAVGLGVRSPTAESRVQDVNLLRQGIDLDPKPRCRFVDQVDCLIRPKTDR